MNRAKRRWFPKKPLCEGGTRGFLIVGIAEVKPALLFLLMGMGVSIAILLVECVFKVLSDRCMKKRAKAGHGVKIKF